MGVFEQFPYLNFHEMNLDWLVKGLKSLDTKVDDLENKIVTPVTPDISALENKVKMLQKNQAPIYLGDYYTKQYGAQGMVVFNGIFHAIAGNAYDNDGTLYRFDLASNTKLAEMTIEMGHGNSMCYSPTTDYVYIIPRFKYTGGVETDEYMIYRYTSDFLSISKISTNFLPRAITRDPVTGKIYVYGVDSKVYLYNEDTTSTEFFCDFNFPTTYVGIDGRNYQLNQDIAAYDDKFYLSGTRGLIYVGELKAGLSDASYGFMLSNQDADCKYWLIENEGMEFTEDGHLLCNYMTIAGGTTTGMHAHFGFLTEINVGVTRPYAASGPINTMHMASYGYKAANAGILSHYIQDLCDPHIIPCLVLHPDTMYIDDAYTSDIGITFWEDINLNLKANVEILSLNIWRGRLNIMCDSGVQLTLTRSSQPINCSRDGCVSFGGSNALAVSLPNISGSARTLIQPDTNTASLNVIAVMPTSVESITLRIGNTTMQKGVFVGQDLLTALP